MMARRKENSDGKKLLEGVLAFAQATLDGMQTYVDRVTKGTGKGEVVKRFDYAGRTVTTVDELIVMKDTYHLTIGMMKHSGLFNEDQIRQLNERYSGLHESVCETIAANVRFGGSPPNRGRIRSSVGAAR